VSHGDLTDANDFCSVRYFFVSNNFVILLRYNKRAFNNEKIEKENDRYFSYYQDSHVENIIFGTISNVRLNLKKSMSFDGD